MLAQSSAEALVTPRDNEHRTNSSARLLHEMNAGNDVIARAKPSVDLDLSVVSSVDVPVTSAAAANRVNPVQSLMATLQTLKTTQRKVATLSSRSNRSEAPAADSSLNSSDVMQSRDVTSRSDEEDARTEESEDVANDEEGQNACSNEMIEIIKQY